MAQSMKYLLVKQEDSSSIPRAHGAEKVETEGSLGLPSWSAWLKH